MEPGLEKSTVDVAALPGDHAPSVTVVEAFSTVDAPKASHVSIGSTNNSNASTSGQDEKAIDEQNFQTAAKPDNNSIENVKLNVESSFQEVSGSTEALPSADAPGTGGQDLPKWRFVCLSVSLGIGLFLSFLDGSITATALYTIGVDFNALTTVTWIALAYSLANLAFAVIFAATADVIGRFNAYLVAQTIFFAFSLACGFAQSLNQLIAFRVLQGVGGSGLYALAMVIWPEMSSLGLKKWIGAFVGLVVAASGVLGPILGGIITNETTWRWIFWINPPIISVSFILFLISWPRSTNVRHHEPSALRQFDLTGCLLLVAGSVLPVFAFQEAGAHQGIWSQGLFIGPLVAGLASWLLLTAWEHYISTRLPANRFNPILPPSLLKKRRYAATVAATLLGGFGYYAVVYNVPLRFQTVNGKSPLSAGVALLPMLCSSAVGSFTAGALSSSRDLLSPTMAGGTALMAIGTGLLSTLSASETLQTKVYGFQVLVGLGFGLTVSAASILANVECELKDHAVAQGLVAQARVLGGSLGLAAGSAILGQRVASELAGVVSPEQTHSLFSAAGSLSPTQMVAVRHTYAAAFSETMRTTAIIAAVAVVVALAGWETSGVPLPERVKAQERREMERVRALRGESGGEGEGVEEKAGRRESEGELSQHSGALPTYQQQTGTTATTAAAPAAAAA